jgi:hypothetical protein
MVEPDLLEPVWRRFGVRADVLGWGMLTSRKLTDDPDLRILAGTHSLKPVAVENGLYLIVLPQERDTLRLVPRAARPSDIRPWVEGV